MTYKLMENDNTHIENKSRMEHQMFREMALDMTFARLHNSLICLLLKKLYQFVHFLNNFVFSKEYNQTSVWIKVYEIQNNS